MLETTDFTLTGPAQDGSLSIVLTRYKFSAPRSVDSPRDRLALIFAHGVSTHKEMWLPTIQYLSMMQDTVPNDDFAIEEAWVMDAYNHGRAAIVNEKAFMARPDGISAYEWARAVQTLLESGLIKGTRTIGIGHSAGTCVMTLATCGYSLDSLPFSSLILVEPPMMSPELLANAMAPNTPLIAAIELAKTRKDVWPSRDAAREWLGRRLPCKLWDKRILQLYVDYALRDLPTATYPDRTEGVTLACTRVQEAAGYVYYQDAFDGLDRLKELCPIMPVHCIFGERYDLVSEEVQNSITDASVGRKMATITKVANAGHMVVQENPKGVAVALFGALHYGPRLRPQSSKL